MDINPDQLLFSFYRKSFSIVFQERIEFDISIVLDCSDFYQYIQRKYSQQFIVYVKEMVSNYQRNVSPGIKLGVLLSFLADCRTDGLSSMLDFGCGKGFMIDYLVRHLTSVKQIWGVDADISIIQESKNKITERLPDIIWCAKLDEVKISSMSLDLAIISHTLHHLNQVDQLRTLDQISDLLKPDGILFVLEDSWSTRCTNQLCIEPEFDDVFNRLSPDEKQEVFRLNDVRANGWFDRRDFNFRRCEYRSAEDWLTILEAKNLHILKFGTVGFDSRRLHGVPSVWIIASKLGN